MTESEKLGVVCILDESNYVDWRRRALGNIRIKGLEKHLKTELGENATAQEKAENVKAAAHLQSWLSDKMLKLVGEDDSAKQVWDKLEEAFRAPGVARWMEYRAQLTSLSKKPEETITDYVSRAQDISSSMRNINKEVPEADLVAQMLHGLPDSYDVWRTLMMRMKEEELTIKNFMPLMLEAEAQLRRQGKLMDPSMSTTALFTKTTNDQHKYRNSGSHNPQQFQHRRHNSGGSHDTRKCYYCNRRGHIQSNCPQKTQDEAAAARLQAAQRRSDGGSAGGRPQKKQFAVARFAAAYLTVNAAELEVDPDTKMWVVDSGASDHMCHDASMFHELRDSAKAKHIMVADGTELEVKGEGTIYAKSWRKSDDGAPEWEMKNVLYVPDLEVNLLSVSTLTEEGYTINFDKKVFNIKKDQEQFAKLGRLGGLYVTWLENSAASTASAMAAGSIKGETLELWHKRMGHLSYGNLQRLVKEEMVNGIKIKTEDLTKDQPDLCEPCAMAKHHKKPFPTSETKTSAILERLHSDLLGPLPPSVGKGAKYIATIIDDYSRYSVVQPIKSKDELSRVMKETIAMFERQSGKEVKNVRSDRGGEYLAEVMQDYFRTKGILHEKTAPETPQQNGVAERFNQTLMDKVRTMMKEAELPKGLWAEVAVTANYLRNRSPVVGKNKTPVELFTGMKPHVNHLRVIGCKGYIHVRGHHNKLEMRSYEGVLVGYELTSKAYRLWVPESHKVVISRDVIFNETARRGSTKPIQQEEVVQLLEEDDDDALNNQAGSPDQQQLAEGDNEYNNSEQNNNNEEATGDDDNDAGETEFQTAEGSESDGDGGDGEQAAESARRYPARERKEPDRFKPAAYASISGSAEVHKPSTIYEAWDSDQGLQWRQATNEEMESLLANNTWELVDQPSGAKVVPVKWVFNVKTTASGDIERYKARLVAKGYEQEAGVDYNEVYAPVSKHATMRSVLSLVAAKDWELHQLDIKTAFLHGELEEDIYIQQPPGYEEGGPAVVCKLKKALYGLRQAPRAWHNRLAKELEKMGFQPSDADPGLWLQRGDGGRILMIVYVDDLLVAGRTEAEVKAIKKQIKEIFDARDLGEAKYFLGMEIERNRINKTIKLSQKKYVKGVLEKYSMEDAKPAKVPLKTATKLTKEDGELLDTRVYPYSELVGALLYAAVCTRPDISQAVGALARYMAEPRKPHWEAAKGVLRYLQGSSEFGLHLGGDAQEGLVGYSDADYAGDLDTRRSTTGYVFKLFGGTVSWASRMQPTVAVSTTEAEYMAAAYAVKEALWLRKLMHDFGVEIPAVKVFGDNQGALKLLKHPIASMRSKHIDVMHHFARDRVARGEVVFEYCSTEFMAADCLTKPVPAPKLAVCCELMNVRV